LRGRDIIAACPVCLYAGSLVPEEILSHCPEGARIVNTAAMDLDAIVAECVAAHEAGQDVARLHSGDLSVWSAMGEQMRRLRDAGVPVSVTPGVPSFAAAAAALGSELTLPGLAQSVVLTRTSGRASTMPEGETLSNFAAVVYRASWPDERIVRATLATIESALDESISRTAIILVGAVLSGDEFDESCLYSTHYDRRYRPQSADSPWSSWSHGDD